MVAEFELLNSKIPKAQVTRHSEFMSQATNLLNPSLFSGWSKKLHRTALRLFLGLHYRNFPSTPSPKQETKGQRRLLGQTGLRLFLSRSAGRKRLPKFATSPSLTNVTHQLV
jgi:hypothetical protein